MNSSKNKLNSKIILIFHPNPNVHYIDKNWKLDDWNDKTEN